LENRDTYRYHDEIDLIGTFSVLWRRKWVFLSLTILTTCLGAVFAFYMPDIYRAYVVVEPGILDMTSDGRYLYLDSAISIKARIDANTYNYRIKESYGENTSMKLHPFNVNILNTANLLQIYLDTRKESADISLQNIRLLVQELQKDYSMEIERKKMEIAKQKKIKENEIEEIFIKRRDLDKQIAIAKNEMKGLKHQSESFQHALAILMGRDKELADEIQAIQKNTERLIQERGLFLEQRSNINDTGLASILYTTTIQQNVSFTNELQSKLGDLRMKMEEIKKSRIDTEQALEEKRLQIEQLELQKNEQLDVQIIFKKIEIEDLEKRGSFVRNVQMLNEPALISEPIGPNRIKIIVLSLIVGCFLGLLAVFIVENSRRAQVQ